jgi:hypothetical protein
MKNWRDKYEEVFKSFYTDKTIVEPRTRPIKYPAVASLAKKICEYFIEQRENNLQISNIGLCLKLGISKPTLDNMKEYSEGHKGLIEAAKSCIEEFWVSCLGTSETSAKFILASMGGYVETTKQIIESDSFTINIKKPENNE